MAKRRFYNPLDAPLPTTGYHITYLDRLPAILQEGFRFDLAQDMRTGALWGEPGAQAVYFVVDPALAEWAGGDRLDDKKAWVIIRAQGLNPNFIVADEDFGKTPQESLHYGGTFAYSQPIPPEMLDVVATARGTPEEYHDSFESLSEPPYRYRGNVSGPAVSSLSTYYHGAPISALPSILQNGLLAGIETRYQAEEASYGGIYFTKSWRYALEMSNGGDQWVGARALLVVAEIDIRTAFLDEDTIPRIGRKLGRLGREEGIEHYTEWLLGMVEEPHPKLAIRVQEIATQIVDIILDEMANPSSPKDIWGVELGNMTIRGLRDKLTRILAAAVGGERHLRVMRDVGYSGRTAKIISIFELVMSDSGFVMKTHYGHPDPDLLATIHAKSKPWF